MREKLKTLGSGAIGILCFVAFGLLSVLFVKGSVWLSEKVFPIVSEVNGYVFWAVLLILLPLSLIRKLRRFTGPLIFMASFLFGATVWFWSVIVTYQLWGWLGLVVGLLVAGIGVLPIAILASLFKGMWSVAFGLVVGIVITYGARLLGAYLTEKSEEAGSTPQTKKPLEIAKDWFKRTPQEVRQCLTCLEELTEEFDGLAWDEVKRKVRDVIQKNPDTVVQTLKEDNRTIRDLVHLLISNISEQCLTHGEYHVYRGMLGTLGPSLKAINRKANEKLIESGFYSKEEVDSINEHISEQIKAVG